MRGVVFYQVCSWTIASKVKQLNKKKATTPKKMEDQANRERFIRILLSDLLRLFKRG